jgi:hypothetical protein
MLTPACSCLGSMTSTISKTMRRNKLHEQAKLVDHRTCDRKGAVEGQHRVWGCCCWQVQGGLGT